jgi:octaprenyl-diphosphate synthase
MKRSPVSSSRSWLGERPGLRRAYAEILKDLDRVEKKLRELSRSNNPLISEIGRYLFQKKGKRMRPALVLLCAKAFKYEGPEDVFLSSLVELIHTSSLIHDDIIDNASTRRGKATLHAKWGPNITVLLGDYLYIKSLNLSLQCRSSRVSSILTDVSMRMIEGEIKEYGLSRKLDLAESDYLDVIDKKTAALISASCRLGGILGQASGSREEALADYGRNLGLCFQLVDDLLDYTGDEVAMGKPVMSDLAEGRVTLPLIYALGQDGGGRIRVRVETLMNKGKDGRRARQEIVDIVRSRGGLDRAYQKAAEYCQKSKDCLARLPRSVYTESLALLADFVLTRDK